MPQAVVTSCWPLPLQACPALHTLLPPRLSHPEPLISCYSTPYCLSKEQRPLGDLHTEVRPNTKLNTRSCVNKEEKGKFLTAVSGASDCISTNNLMYPASVEYLSKQQIIPILRQCTLGATVDLRFAFCN